MVSLKTEVPITERYNKPMSTVYISIGSNVNAELNIRAAIKALKIKYGALRVSTVYQNKAMGFDGDDFLNLVVGLKTAQSIAEFVDCLHQIEASQGRLRNQARFSPRTLDMDLLLYADEIFKSPHIDIPRDEITCYAFVLQPLFELAPDYVHPRLKQTITQLWSEFDKTTQPLTPLELSF